MDTLNDSLPQSMAAAKAGLDLNNDQTSFAQRLVTLESVVATMQHQLATLNPPTSNWLQQISGTFKDDPGFDNILAYGQAIRQADRPNSEVSELSDA